MHVNGAHVKASKEVAAGDTVEITTRGIKRTVQVTGIAERRGSTKLAATLYAESDESIAAREKHLLDRRLARPLGSDLGARPTKLDRRRLDALRRAQRRSRDQ